MTKTVSKQDVMERSQTLIWSVKLTRAILPVRLRLLWWAILGRPIIYGVHFVGGFKFVGKHALIAGNIIENLDSQSG